jgi:hypothetical protein
MRHGIAELVCRLCSQCSDWSSLGRYEVVSRRSENSPKVKTILAWSGVRSRPAQPVVEVAAAQSWSNKNHATNYSDLANLVTCLVTSVANLPTGNSSLGIDRLGISLPWCRNPSDPHRFELQKLSTGSVQGQNVTGADFVTSDWA